MHTLTRWPLLPGAAPKQQVYVYRVRVSFRTNSSSTFPEIQKQLTVRTSTSDSPHCPISSPPNMHLHSIVALLTFGLFSTFSHASSSESFSSVSTANDLGHGQGLKWWWQQHLRPARDPHWGINGRPYPEARRYHEDGKRWHPNEVQARFKQATNAEARAHWSVWGTESLKRHYDDDLSRFQRDVRKEIDNRGATKGNYASAHLKHAEEKAPWDLSPTNPQGHVHSAATAALRFWRQSRGMYEYHDYGRPSRPAQAWLLRQKRTLAARLRGTKTETGGR